MPITYYKTGERWGLPDLSPFCLKLESFMRLHNIDFSVSDMDIRQALNKAPKKKVPFIEFETGELLGDSGVIIERLAQDRGIDVFDGLNDVQRASGHALIRMLDEHLYFCLVYARWIDPKGWDVMSPALFASVPGLLRGVISRMIRKSVRKKLWEQGIGRHSADMIYDMAAVDLQAAADLLQNDTWFFGAPKPTLVDLCVHSYLANILYVDVDCPLREDARRHDNLMAHTNGLHSLIYGKRLDGRKNDDRAHAA